MLHPGCRGRDARCQYKRGKFTFDSYQTSKTFCMGGPTRSPVCMKSIQDIDNLPVPNKICFLLDNATLHVWAVLPKFRDTVFLILRENKIIFTVTLDGIVLSFYFFIFLIKLFDFYMKSQILVPHGCDCDNYCLLESDAVYVVW
jgi:hypothetical protein